MRYTDFSSHNLPESRRAGVAWVRGYMDCAAGVDYATCKSHEAGEAESYWLGWNSRYEEDNL